MAVSLFGLLLAFWSGPGQTYVISVIGGHIRSDFSLSNSEFGGIYTVATLVCAALLWKAGLLVDRLPLKSFVDCVGFCNHGEGSTFFELSVNEMVVCWPWFCFSPFLPPISGKET
ncbi:MAG: hypothetical protein WDZ54_02290 [Sneathiella sp.]